MPYSEVSVPISYSMSSGSVSNSKSVSLMPSSVISPLLINSKVSESNPSSQLLLISSHVIYSDSSSTVP